MKRVIFAVLCMLMIVIYSCEKDDFCLSNPVTSNLVIRFHDAENNDETKVVDSLYVWADGRDTLDLVNNASTDSIAIPLNTLEESTVYNLARGNDFIDTFTISYTTEEDFVSRSCGFRVIFNDLSLNHDTEGTETSWVSSFETETTIINSQENAHVKIFH